MKKFFVSGWYMINDIKGSLKGVLDNLPYIMALGIIMGTGAYATVFGALIISAANFFTRNKTKKNFNRRKTRQKVRLYGIF